MAIEQLGFFSVPYLLSHGASVYNGHLQGPVALTPIAERLAVEMSQPVFMTKVFRGLDSKTQPSTCEANALTLADDHYKRMTRVTVCVTCKRTLTAYWP